MKRIIYTNFQGKERKFVIEMDIKFDESTCEYIIETPQQRIKETSEFVDGPSVIAKEFTR